MDAAGTIYIPNISLLNEETIIVCSRLPFTSTATLLRAAVDRSDPKLALFDVVPLTVVVDRSVEARRLASQILGILGALALILNSLGVYGVLSYATAERVPEIVIRMAIGTRPASILAMVLRDGLTLDRDCSPRVRRAWALSRQPHFRHVDVQPVHLANGVVTIVVAATAATLIPAR